MGSDPGFRTHRKELIRKHRLLKGEDPESTDTASGIFLEMWESDGGDRSWAVAYLDDYRHHIGSGIRIRVDDDVAGWLQRNYTEGDHDA